MAVTPDLRRRMADAAVAVARTVEYSSAGTIEFLLDRDGAFYFLEMNTRLQVEHPVTEMVTSIDLVHWQIRIARGERLTVDPGRALTPHGHAIECRIYAEDPDQGFLPSPGLIRGLRPAAGPGVRDDGGVSVGYTVPVYYDSMIAKLVVWGGSRREAVDRMARALREYQVLGIRTTIPFFLWLMRQPEYLDGRYDTTYLDRLLAERAGRTFSDLTAEEEELTAMAVAVDAYLRVSEGQAAARQVDRRGCGSRPRGARRCASDVRDRDRRPQPYRVGRAHGGRPVPRDCRRQGARRGRGPRRRLRIVAAPRRPSGEQPRDTDRAVGKRRGGAAARRDRRPHRGRDRQRAACAARRRARRRRHPRRAKIVAPMPGRVVRVLVAPGDTVVARQGVVVVEAMKMENELRSPKAGRVKDVAATPGMSVEAGRVLVVIE